MADIEMTGSEVATAAAPAPEDRELQVDVIRDHGNTAMSQDEFSDWIDENFGKNNVSKAMQQAAFLLCCDVIAQDISKAPLFLRQRLPNGTSKVVQPGMHEMADMLAMEPNHRHTWPEFMEMVVLWQCISSNSYAGVLRARDGTPLELIPFQSSHVFETIGNRQLFYNVFAGTQHEDELLGASSAVFPEVDMIHVRGRMLDGMNGLSTMDVGRSTLDAGAELDKFRSNIFSSDGQIRGVFTKGGDGAVPLPEDAFQRLRGQMKILMNKFRSLSEPVILEGGMKFEPISSKPVDIEFVKQMGAQIVATCRLMRVPPHKVFHMDGEKYSNLETSEKMYVGDTLVPICTRFETRFSKILLSRKDRLKYFFEIDRESLLLRDSARVNEQIKTAVERGVIEVDEARAKWGFNPLPNGQGQVRLIPVNMSVVDRKGNVVVSASSSETSDTPEETPDAADAADNETPEAQEGKAFLRLVEKQ